MNYFIAQFGNPKGTIGKVFAKIMNISNGKMYRANLKMVNSNTSKLLEIGFGNGRQIEMIKSRYPDCSVCGIDLSMDMYQAALKKIGDKAVISVGNAEALPYEEEVFHMVMTTDTCYFWENPQRVLSEIYRTLKRNGLFVNSYNTMYAAAVAGSNRDALADDASIIAAAK